MKTVCERLRVLLDSVKVLIAPNSSLIILKCKRTLINQLTVWLQFGENATTEHEWAYTHCPNNFQNIVWHVMPSSPNKS